MTVRFVVAPHTHDESTDGGTIPALATMVTASAVLPDDYVIHGDGGGRGVKALPGVLGEFCFPLMVGGELSVG